MSAPGFTRGPWDYAAKLTASENHRGFFVRAPNGHGRWALAEVQPGDSDGVLGEANSRLIAAAPELYEALRDLEAYVLGTVHHNAPQAAAARAALAKAVQS